jgi:hypothetical protein
MNAEDSMSRGSMEAGLIHTRYPLCLILVSRNFALVISPRIKWRLKSLLPRSRRILPTVSFIFLGSRVTVATLFAPSSRKRLAIA